MLFLRLTIFSIIALGTLSYLVTVKIRSEFSNNRDKINPVLRDTPFEYKAFCKNPPTQYAAHLLKTRKKLFIALAVAVIAFSLAMLAAILEQT